MKQTTASLTQQNSQQTPYQALFSRAVHSIRSARVSTYSAIISQYIPVYFVPIGSIRTQEFQHLRVRVRPNYWVRPRRYPKLELLDMPQYLKVRHTRTTELVLLYGTAVMIFSDANKYERNTEKNNKPFRNRCTTRPTAIKNKNVPSTTAKG